MSSAQDPTTAADDLDLAITRVFQETPDSAQEVIDRLTAEVLDSPERRDAFDRAGRLLDGWMPALDRPTSAESAADATPISALGAAQPTSPGMGLVVIFVNGIWTSPESASSSKTALARLLAPGLPGALVTNSLNRSDLQREREWFETTMCLGLWVTHPIATALGRCDPLASDLFAALQMGNKESWRKYGRFGDVNVSDLGDTAQLGAVTLQFLNRGARVILVPHSQGNYLVRDALLDIASSPIGTAVLDRVGVVMTGSPVAPEGMPSLLGARLREVIKEGDPVVWAMRGATTPISLEEVLHNHYFQDGYLTGWTAAELSREIREVAALLFPEGFNPEFRITGTRAMCSVNGHIGVRLDWSAATGAKSYEVLRDGAAIGTTRDLTFLDTDAAGVPSYRVRALIVDPAGDSTYVESDPAPTLVPQDLCAAPLPATVSSYAVGCRNGQPKVTLRWDVPSDVSGFRVFRDGTAVSGSLASSQREYTDDLGLVAGSQYSYVVRAYRGSEASSSSPFAVVIPVGACETSGLRADLRVTGLALNPRSGIPGTAVNISGQIVNQGTTTSATSSARVRLATTSVDVTTSDLLLATLDVPEISANSTWSFNRTVTLPNVSTGLKYFWCIADVDHTAGQTDETNDKAFVDFSVDAVSTVPDLRVLNGSVTLTGATVSASWTIKNAGGATANASTTVVRINQSTSSAAGANLDSIGTASLGAGASKPQSTSLTAPSAAGTYQVWVIADNGSTSGQSTTTDDDDLVRIGSFTVSTSSDGPDLQVVNGTVSLSGSTVSASWTIKNAGGSTANASTTVVRINQSTSSAAGSNLDTISTSSLAAGSTKAQSSTLTASSTAGTYQVWVITDNTSTAGQSSTADNDDIVRIGSFTVAPPDLQVQSGSVSLSGSTVSASWKIKNTGTATAGTSTTVVRINQSTTSASGTNLSSISTSSLTGGSSTSQSATLTASSTPGTYYVWVITDNYSTAGQTSTTDDNDIVRIGSFTVTAPDLQVQSGSVSYAGGTVSASWKIKNTGTATAGASTTVVRINQSSTSASGSNLASISTSSLNGGTSTSQSSSITAPSGSGTFYVWVITDNYSAAGQSSTTDDNDIVRIGSYTK